MCFGIRRCLSPNSQEIQPNATTSNGPVFDLKQALFGGMPPKIHSHKADFKYLRHPAGNMIQFARGLDVARLRLITLKSAEALRFTHSIGAAHGNGTFLLHADCITLLDVGLYGLGQKELDYISLTPCGGGYVLGVSSRQRIVRVGGTSVRPFRSSELTLRERKGGMRSWYSRSVRTTYIYVSDTR
ncbi:hypothetical protein BDQ17DRAFT_108110 [Cyathus striatus]|nr:hypothetical protein BDQ17DRAFT_108110 [Cyathus striatus]